MFVIIIAGAFTVNFINRTLGWTQVPPHTKQCRFSNKIKTDSVTIQLQGELRTKSSSRLLSLDTFRGT